MHLVQILLPVRDNAGRLFPAHVFAAVRAEVVEAFGGVTTYSRAPAAGAWQDDRGAVAREDVVVCEVMVPELDRSWWAGYRERLEARFAQEELVVRALGMERL